MVNVRTIRPHHAGFGHFQIGESALYEFDSAEEYAESVAEENEHVRLYAIDPNIAEMAGEDGERLAAAIRDASGVVQGGHGTIVAFLVGDDIQLESVDVETAAAVPAGWDSVETYCP